MPQPCSDTDENLLHAPITVYSNSNVLTLNFVKCTLQPQSRHQHISPALRRPYPQSTYRPRDTSLPTPRLAARAYTTGRGLRAVRKATRRRGCHGETCQQCLHRHAAGGLVAGTWNQEVGCSGIDDGSLRQYVCPYGGEFGSCGS